jgi:hypothetical protein
LYPVALPTTTLTTTLGDHLSWISLKDTIHASSPLGNTRTLAPEVVTCNREKEQHDAQSGAPTTATLPINPAIIITITTS